VATVLGEELKHYQAIWDELLKTTEGQFVLVKGSELLETFPSWDEAYAFGLDRLGNQPFLIKQVLAKEPVHWMPAYELGLLRARL
jgi:hypothetical protein